MLRIIPNASHSVSDPGVIRPGAGVEQGEKVPGKKSGMLASAASQIMGGHSVR
jgi:hypothetical protein